MVVKDFGGTDVFKEQDLPQPQPGPNKVFVRVRATSINPVDIKIRRTGSWAGIQPQAIIGYDIAGVVEAVGEAVVDFVEGDKVYYTSGISDKPGSYAEYHMADASIVTHMPSNLSFPEVVSIPLAGGTAWDALITRAALQVGETVVIVGAGGVGYLAVQIARSAGAQVFAVCSDYMVDVVRELSAEDAINYKREDFVEIVRQKTNDEGVEVLFDTVGGDNLSGGIVVTQPFGRIVGIVNIMDGSLSAALCKNLTLHFCSCNVPPIN